MTVMSVFHHGSPCELIYVIDKAVAHLAFVLILCETPRVLSSEGREWLIVLPLSVLVLWMMEGVWPKHAVALHAGLHVISAFGAMTYMHNLYGE